MSSIFLLIAQIFTSVSYQTVSYESILIVSSDSNYPSLNFHNLICETFFPCCSRNGLKESKTVVCLNIFWFVTSRKTMFVLYIFILSVTLWALLNIYKSRLIFPENPPNSTEYVTSSWHPTTKSETTKSKYTNTETTNPELSITHCMFLKKNVALLYVNENEQLFNDFFVCFDLCWMYLINTFFIIWSKWQKAKKSAVLFI